MTRAWFRERPWHLEMEIRIRNSRDGGTAEAREVPKARPPSQSTGSTELSAGGCQARSNEVGAHLGAELNYDRELRLAARDVDYCRR
ncbi:hypothetical protein NDU88_001004 [Pleurodeles waltl]|uniref:Uncharacterized protein n=1 Tax=Pleurodeles waltl TaxID=8319 RepID=A0AAV7URL2_PLEWA|nr:hypothetical protein NDU88_001004 [Pleurodeles waltl]